MHITTVSRLHIGLIDLDGGLGRVDGGVGLALEGPNIELEATESDRLEVDGPLSDPIRGGAKAVLDHVNGKPVSIKVDHAFPEHVGLGSGTQAALAGGAAVAETNDLDLSVQELAKITGRGGTSGIGTASFDSGGFILDSGHSLEQKDGFLPSSESPAPPPKVLSRFDFPNWKITLLLPEGKGAHSEDELSIFEEECPIPEREVEKTSRIILTKLLPSVAEENFGDFRDAIKRLQNVGFKRREVDLQLASKELLETMHDRGCAAGMSSFGPVVYAIHPDEVDTSDLDYRTFETSASNTGAEINIE